MGMRPQALESWGAVSDAPHKVRIHKRPFGPWYRNFKKARLPAEGHDKETYYLFRT